MFYDFMHQIAKFHLIVFDELGKECQRFITQYHHNVSTVSAGFNESVGIEPIIR